MKDQRFENILVVVKELEHSDGCTEAVCRCMAGMME